MPSHIEDTLERCLALRAGGETVENCVSDLDPSLRREIEGLLAVGETIRYAPRPGLSPSALAHGERRLMARAAELRREHPPTRPIWVGRPGWLGMFTWRPRLVPAAVALTLLLSLGVFTGAGTVIASAGPEDPLYGVKRSWEQTRVTLSPSLAQRAQTHVDLAQERIDEMAVLARRGRPIPGWLIDQAEEAIAQALVISDQLADADAVAVLRRVVGLLSYERLVLRLAADTAPHEDPDVLQHGLRAASEAERDVDEALGRRLQQSLSGAGSLAPAVLDLAPTVVPPPTVLPTSAPAPTLVRHEAEQPARDGTADRAPRESLAPAERPLEAAPPEAEEPPGQAEPSSERTGGAEPARPLFAPKPEPPVRERAGQSNEERKDEPPAKPEPSGPRAENKPPTEAPGREAIGGAPKPASPPKPAEPPRPSDDPPPGPRPDDGPKQQEQDNPDRAERQDANSPAGQSGGTVNPGLEAGDGQRHQDEPGGGQRGSGRGGGQSSGESGSGSSGRSGDASRQDRGSAAPSSPPANQPAPAKKPDRPRQEPAQNESGSQKKNR